MSDIMEESKGKKEDVSEAEKFLYQLNKSLYKFNTTKLDHDVVAKLSEYSQRILEKRRKARGFQPNPKKESDVQQQKQTRVQGGSSEIIEEYDESMESSLAKMENQRKLLKVKPSLLKNLNSILINLFLAKV